MASSFIFTVYGKNGENLMKCDDSNLQKMMDYVNLTITKQTHILQDMLVKNCPGRRMNKCVENVSYNKSTGQSSTLSPSADYNSSHGVDGLTPSGYEHMIHTNTEKNPFWWVNLGREYLVERVEIWNREICCAERTRNMDVTVGPTLNDMNLCAHYKGPSQKGEHLVLGCTKRMRGRYVKLQIQGTVALNLLEVKVFALKTCSN